MKKAIDDVVTGEQVIHQGYLWEVKETAFESGYGGGARCVLYVEQVVRDGERPLPDPYRYGMSIGKRSGMAVTVEA